MRGRGRRGGQPEASGLFAAGVSYRLTLTATINGASRFSTCQVTFNSPPRNCQLYVTRTDGETDPGIELNTTHTLTVDLCVDTEVPLRYEFSFRPRNSRTTRRIDAAAQVSGTRTGITFPFEGDGNVTVYARVIDQLGAASRVEAFTMITETADVDVGFVNNYLGQQNEDISRGSSSTAVLGMTSLMTKINKQ